MRILVENKDGCFGVSAQDDLPNEICGCTRYLHNITSDWAEWADWAIETHTFLRNTIGLE